MQISLILKTSDLFRNQLLLLLLIEKRNLLMKWKEDDAQEKKTKSQREWKRLKNGEL